ncbi:MAG TPA: tetratricopeptide repeat protein [Salinimicrobium sp.]|nr:tetratricopeptide repeat protein [Salinimicrobium sp.]
MKKYLVIFLFCGFALSLPLSAQEETTMQDVNVDDLGNVTDEFQEYFFEGLKQRGIENYEKAIAALEKSRQINALPVVFFEIGKNYKSLENYPSAIENFQKAHQKQPDNKDIIAELYDAYYLAKDYENAVTTVKKLIVFDPDFTEDLANLYVLTEQYDEALKVLDQLDSEFGSSEYRNGLRTRIYGMTNDKNSQITLLENRIAEDPENEDNYLNLIFVYSANGEEQKAFETAELLISKNPDSELAHLALYKFYLTNKDTSEAIKSMEIVLKSDAIDAESKYKVLNDFLIFVNENPQYEEKLEEIVAVFSNLDGNSQVYEKLGDYYTSKQLAEKAVQFYSLGLARDEGNFNLLKQVILLNLDLMNFSEAKKHAGEALEYYPSQPLFYLLLGVAENNLNQFKNAEEALLTGLDYIIEDKKMQTDFYKQLIIAAEGLGKIEKKNEYEKQLLKLK